MRGTGVWVSAFRNSVIHQIFSEFLQPFQDFGTKRVSPFFRGYRFYLVLDFFGWLGQRVFPFFPFNMVTWHSYWSGIYPTQIFICSSLTVAWHSCGLWSRRAWGRCRMINLLPWGCQRCWRGKTAGRTRWQTRNHDRNEVLRVARYPNTVF